MQLSIVYQGRQNLRWLMQIFLLLFHPNLPNFRGPGRNFADKVPNNMS